MMQKKLKGEYNNLTSHTKINFLCVCGNEESNKEFRYIVQCSGALCKNCSRINKCKKMCDTKKT